jgi:fructose-1,6-bisphosphatase II
MVPNPLSATPSISAREAPTRDPELVRHVVAATRAAAVAAAAWAGRGDPVAADEAATVALRRRLAAAPGTGTVVTGEGAKDDAPMLADGELVGSGAGTREYDVAVDPLECTDLCARGLPGAISTIAFAPSGSMWSPGPCWYMEKLVLPPAARDAARIGASIEETLDGVAAALGRRVAELRVVVLDKPRHHELVGRLREAGAAVATPPAGDVAAALQVVLADGGADLLLGIGGAPEGVLAACAVGALGGGMQGRPAPQREGERLAMRAAGLSCERVLDLDELVAGDAVFVATGVTGGLLGAPRREHGWLITDSIVVAAGAVHRIRTSTRHEE